MNRSLSVSTYKTLLNCYFSFSLSPGFHTVALDGLHLAMQHRLTAFLYLPVSTSLMLNYKHSQLYFCTLAINDLPTSGCYVGNILLFDIIIAEHNIILVIWVSVCRRTYTGSILNKRHMLLFISSLFIYLSVCLWLSVYFFFKILYVPLKARRGC